MNSSYSIVSLFKRETQKITKDVIAWRRWFHRHPETGFEEHKTSEKIRELLKDFGISFVRCAGTGVVATLKGSGKGPALGLRADMDALPIQEETGLPFASVHPGIMHACGHDGHTATLLGVARILARHRHLLKGTVKFIFQPCEEKPPGGAPAMVKEGVADGLDHIISFHFFPTLPLCRISLKEGAIMAITDEFSIVVEGKGGHGSAPHHTADPIVAAAHIVTALQTIISRKIDPLRAAVVSFGGIHGGSAFNIIPDTVEIRGTVRTLDEKSHTVIRREMKKIAAGVGGGMGCRTTLRYNTYSPAVVNDPAFTAVVGKATEKILPPAALDSHPVSMGGEDFAFFSRKAPSCYIIIGSGKESGQLHNSRYTLNEETIPFAVHYLSCLAALLSG